MNVSGKAFVKANNPTVLFPSCQKGTGPLFSSLTGTLDVPAWIKPSRLQHCRLPLQHTAALPYSQAGRPPAPGGHQDVPAGRPPSPSPHSELLQPRSSRPPRSPARTRRCGRGLAGQSRTDRPRPEPPPRGPGPRRPPRPERRPAPHAAPLWARRGAGGPGPGSGDGAATGEGSVRGGCEGSGARGQRGGASGERTAEGRRTRGTGSVRSSPRLFAVKQELPVASIGVLALCARQNRLSRLCREQRRRFGASPPPRPTEPGLTEPRRGRGGPRREAEAAAAPLSQSAAATCSHPPIPSRLSSRRGYKSQRCEAVLLGGGLGGA